MNNTMQVKTTLIDLAFLFPRLIFLSLLLLTGCAATSIDRSTEVGLLKESILDGPVIQITDDCFSGIYLNYAAWRQDALAKNVPAKGFDSRFPKDEYDLFSLGLQCFFFEYAVEDLAIEGYIVFPSSALDSKTPVVIYNRGGNADFGRMNTGRMFHTVFPIANSGKIVIGSQYRGGRKRGHKIKNAGQDEFGGSDVEDVLALLDIIDQLPIADRERIGMLGWSRGGFMTYLAAAESNRFATLATAGTPADLALELENRPRMERVYRARIPDYDTNTEAALRARSPLFIAEQIGTPMPVLLMHGQFDKAVGVKSALMLSERLVELGFPVRTMIFENGDHGLWGHREEMQQVLVDWFDKTL